MRRLACILILILAASLASVTGSAQQFRCIPPGPPDWIAGAQLQQAKAVVIAIDNSGSIRAARRLRWEKLCAKEVVDFLDQFNPTAVLEVVSFNSDFKVLVPPTPFNNLNLNNVKAAIDGIRDTGNLTWINGVIDHACTVTQPRRPLGTLVLLTDGRPTTPIKNGMFNIPAAMNATGASAINFLNNCSTLGIIGLDVRGADLEFLQEIASPGAFLLVTTPP